MKQAILARLRELGAADRVELEAKVRRQLAELERELAEVQQLVPFWNRVVFFVETADLRREKDLITRVAATRAELERARRDARRDLDQVGFELPPFAVACELEDCLGLAASGGEADRRALPEALGKLAKRLDATWAPGFDIEAALEKLTSATACQEAAALAAGIQRDPVLGYSVSENQLVPLIAARVLAGAYFAEQERAWELTSRRNRLDQELEAASAGVSLLDKMNPFSFSPSEVKRNELARTLATTQEELRACRDLGRKHLEDALAAYPPLGLYQMAQEALAVAEISEPERETTLTAGGRVQDVPADGARVLVLAALARLRDAFRAAFPDTPFPGELDGVAREAPQDPIVRAYLGEISRSGAAAVRERALDHLAGGCREAESRTGEEGDLPRGPAGLLAGVRGEGRQGETSGPRALAPGRRHARPEGALGDRAGARGDSPAVPSP